MVYKVSSNAIEIAASPARVREVVSQASPSSSSNATDYQQFLDFARLAEWHSAHIRSIEIATPHKKAADLQKGDKLRVVLKGMSFSPTVLVRTYN